MTDLLRLASGQELAVTRRTGGARCVLFLHGFPCTRRLYDRVIPQAAAAGWDAVAVDLRGFGDSELPGDGRYDLAAHSEDLTQLLDSLGYRQAVLVAHDLGASVALQMAGHRPELVEGMLLMNHVIPVVDPTGASFTTWTTTQRAQIFDYAEQQGQHAEELMQRLTNPQQRLSYIADFYTTRGWCPPDKFSAAEVSYLVEPFATAERLRASFRDYEILAGTYPGSREVKPATENLSCPISVLLGINDVTLVAQAEERCRAAYPNLVGVRSIHDAGHFLPWERPAALLDTLDELGS